MLQDESQGLVHFVVVGHSKPGDSKETPLGIATLNIHTYAVVSSYHLQCVCFAHGCARLLDNFNDTVHQPLPVTETGTSTVIGILVVSVNGHEALATLV
jgi:hypothetical protein